MIKPTLRKTVEKILAESVPGAVPDKLDGSSDLHDALDMDSLDELHFAVALGEAFDIEVPETDYPQLATLDSCVAYLEDATAAAKERSSS